MALALPGFCCRQFRKLPHGLTQKVCWSWRAPVPEEYVVKRRVFFTDTIPFRHLILLTEDKFY